MKRVVNVQKKGLIKAEHEMREDERRIGKSIKEKGYYKIKKRY